MGGGEGGSSEEMEMEIRMVPEPWINREIWATKCCVKTKHCGWKAGGESAG